MWTYSKITVYNVLYLTKSIQQSKCLAILCREKDFLSFGLLKAKAAKSVSNFLLVAISAVLQSQFYHSE